LPQHPRERQRRWQDALERAGAGRCLGVHERRGGGLPGHGSRARPLGR
jgi:hypothetical protein